jgi:predicted nucleic acid-binding protein
MVVVDSSVWVDYFNGRATRETDQLDALLGVEPVAIGDLILVEVLQGFRNDRDYRSAKNLLTSLTVYDMLGAAHAVHVADNYRALRKKGITIRKTADAIIATFCITRNLPLLFSDKDFEPFVKHLALQRAI